MEQFLPASPLHIITMKNVGGLVGFRLPKSGILNFTYKMVFIRHRHYHFILENL